MRTYANVVSTLALFVALGGGAYAAATLPARSVGARQLKRDAVITSKIRRNAVDGSKVLNNSLTGADIDESTLRKVRSAVRADRAVAAVTALTAARATTATDAAHAAAAGALDDVAYESTTASLPGIDESNVPTTASAGCDPGTQVIAGGARVDDPTAASVADEYPDKGNAAWTVRVVNAEPKPHHVTVYAICIAVARTG
jgi:hypothetical protein